MSDRDSRAQPALPESEERLLARRYMLGGLTPQQQDDAERRFLFDPAFEDIVLEEETDLFDALAAGTLSSEDERALRLWASAQQRTQTRLDAAIAFHRLNCNIAPHPLPRISVTRNLVDSMRTPRFSALWLAGITAASIAVMTAFVWTTRQHPAAPAPASSAIASATRPAPVATPILATPAPSSTSKSALPSQLAPSATMAPARPASVTIFLMAEETRSASTPPKLDLKPGNRSVILQLASQTGLSAGSHTVQLTGPGGSKIQPTGLSSRHLRGKNFVEVNLNAADLKLGEYTVLLHQNGPGPAPDLTFHFQIAVSPTHP